MGWAFGELPDGTAVGYGVPDVCNEDGCDQAIDRGLAYVCGGMHGGDGVGCGGYFCGTHLEHRPRPNARRSESQWVQVCSRCAEELPEEDEAEEP